MSKVMDKTRGKEKHLGMLLDMMLEELAKAVKAIMGGKDTDLPTLMDSESAHVVKEMAKMQEGKREVWELREEGGARVQGLRLPPGQAAQ